MENNEFFPKAKGKLGFGIMRLPMKDGAVDFDLVTEMVDAYMAAGYNYFDTAHGYLDGASEEAVRRCLTSRYPRESYVLTDKLTDSFIKKPEDVRAVFEDQLKACGVEYFDFYLLHAVRKQIYDYFNSMNSIETIHELMEEGKIKHFGISFHDTAEMLDIVLTEHPEIEFVQMQLNYLDYDDVSIQSGKVYEMAKKHGKPIVIMEPVKGGNLHKLSPEAAAAFDKLGKDCSYASYAVRFAACRDDLFMMLSGMSDMEQMLDNIKTFEDLKPLDEAELAAKDEVIRVIKSKGTIPCTACRYCTAGCPQKINIPALFATYNNQQIEDIWRNEYYYRINIAHGGKASDCIKCGACEAACPQGIQIRDMLEKVADTFENWDAHHQE